MVVARDLSTCPNRTGRIRATLHQYCTDHAVKPVYPADGDSLQLLSPRVPTDLARRCDWLSRSVAGTAQEVAAALGVRNLLALLGVEDVAEVQGPRRGGAPHGHHAYEDRVVD